MTEALWQSDLPGLPPPRRGKVRDVYDLGEALLIVSGEERPLKRWDLFHCPAGVDHAIVGAGDGPCLVLAVGARTGDEEDGLVYPADPVAQKHGAGPEVETTQGKEAYAKFELRHTAYQEGWLPD